MFVYSVRASALRFFIVIVLTVCVVVFAVAFGALESEASYSAVSESIDFSGIRTNEDRLEFISRHIPEISGEPKEEVSFNIPESFDRILMGYNEIQKAQGLDLTRYKNKKVTRYTYELPRLGDYDAPVFVNLIVYRNTVIACDVSSADPDGFVKPLVVLP